MESKQSVSPGVAICVDELMLDCAGNLLWSLTEVVDDPVDEILVLHENLPQKKQDALKCAARDGEKANCRFIRVDTRRWRRGGALHGNFMTWTKFDIPDHSESRMTLYVDCDVVALKSPFRSIGSLDLGGGVLGAVCSGIQKTSLESEFFQRQGFDPLTPYFNAGVLLFDNEKWRRSNLVSTALELAERHKDFCRSADQTIFNLMFSSNVACLPGCLNVPAYPGDFLCEGDIENACLVHFVGSPKPWDFGAGRLHFNSAIYDRVAARNPEAHNLRPPMIGRLVRSVRLARSYWKLMERRFR